uniref:FBD domain-containing protein n=1 Tax=Leersia perrieri TaxID=77586 RepID=A0A0D9WWX9_9ORYZ
MAGVDDGGVPVDRLSSLPGDVLHLILLRLCSAEAAARTSFESDVKLAVLAALAANAAPAIRRLQVATDADDPDATTATLLLAAPRLAGEISFCSWPRWGDSSDDDDDDDVMPPVRSPGVVDLPCFEKATEIWLTLGLLGVALPQSGVFARLTSLTFRDVRFTADCDLGEVVSSARCPLLQKLHVHASQDLCNLVIFSESLVHIELQLHGGMGEFMIVAPRLRVLDVPHCFSWRTYRSDSLVWDQPFAAVFAPVLEDLIWVDAYDPASVKFGFGTERLQKVKTLPIKVYEHPRCTAHMNSVKLLQRFETVSVLQLELNYPETMGDQQYLMEAITKLPTIEVLSLVLSARGHTFGHCVFHLLKMSTGIRKLELTLQGDHDSQEWIMDTMWFLGHQTKTCSESCICNQSQDWKTADILDSLLEVEISGLKGSENELAFVKQLFGWSAVLKTLTVHLHLDLTDIDDLCKELLSLGTPDTDVKIYFFHPKTSPPWKLYTPPE